MTSRRRASQGRRINPHIWVFCEGETEEEYVNFLKREYRLPIEIITKVAGNRINTRYINECKRGLPQHESDKTFLIYDSDILAVMERLSAIRGVTIILSNPSIEIWYLLHYKNQRSQIITTDCIRELSNRNRIEYKKGHIDVRLHEKLTICRHEACRRSRVTKIPINPSTNFHEFIEFLEEQRNLKD